MGAYAFLRQWQRVHAGAWLLAPYIHAAQAQAAQPGETTVHRDWKMYPAIIQLDTSEPVYAIGDPHGDWQQLAKVLGAATLIDKNTPLSAPDQVKWT